MILLKRLTRRDSIVAEFSQVKGDDAAVQLLTDSMANSFEVQIEYEGSGWRTVTPYGWNTSAAGDLLVMCYKAGMEIRSYRLDRVQQLYVNSALLDPSIEVDESEVVNPSSFVIPQIPDVDELLALSESEQGSPEPFAEAVDELELYNQTGLVGDEHVVNDENVGDENVDDENVDDENTGDESEDERSEKPDATPTPEANNGEETPGEQPKEEQNKEQKDGEQEDEDIEAK